MERGRGTPGSVKWMENGTSLKIRALKKQKFWGGNDEFSFALAKSEVCMGHPVGR